MTQTQNLPFSEFLTHLTRQGFIIGVDHHLRLQTLLNTLGPECRPADLKYLLCPLFATNAKQQQQFYHAFDAYFAAFEPERAAKEQAAAEEEKRVVKPPEPLPIKRWQYVLFGGLLLILVALLSYQWQYGPLLLLPATPTPTPVSTPMPAATPISTPKPEASPTAVPTPSPPQGPEQKKSSWKSTIYQLKIFYQTYWFTIRWVGILTPLIIFGLLEWYRWNRRKLVLEKRRGKKPPLVWPVRVDAPDPVFLKHARLYEAARLMRQRLPGDVYQLDVDQTIATSVQSGGFPQELCYRALTKPPEYLVLIDLPFGRDHCAYLADSMVSALEREGLFVTRYFYDQNPRVCFRTVNGEREYLVDLAGKYQDHRLLIFGGGESLLDPVSGELDAWTMLFHKWRDRALLTTVPPAEWSVREITLARDFIVLPASLDGLAALVEHFENPAKLDLKAWKGKNPLLTPPRRGIPTPGVKQVFPSWEGLGVGDLLTDLRAYLGEDVFQWLCACAVYPELHWNLTLYLGSLPCMPENLITEENLLRLIRLPWFREGVMPDELRWQLLSELDAEKNQTIRAAIFEILEQNPPPAESLASDTYSLNLVVQRWMLSPQRRKQRRELRQSLQTVRDARLVQDYTLVRFLETAPTSALTIILPSRLRKIFYKNGLPIFGLRTGFRGVVAVLFAVIMFLLINIYQVVVIRSPQSGTETVQSSIQVSGTVSDWNIPTVDMIVNDRRTDRIRVVNGEFQKNIVLDEGENRLQVRALTNYGESSDSISVIRKSSPTPIPPPPPIPPPQIIAFEAEPRKISMGQAVILRWKTANADEVFLNGKSVKSAGEQRVIPQVSTFYELVAINQGGEDRSILTIDVLSPPPSTSKIIDFGVDPQKIEAGQVATIWWETANADEVFLNGTPVELSGERKVSPTKTTTYELVVVNKIGKDARQVRVEVLVPSPKILDFGVDPQKIKAGQVATIWWETVNAEEVFLNGKPVKPSDKQEVSPKETTKYELIAINKEGKDIRTITLYVR